MNDDDFNYLLQKDTKKIETLWVCIFTKRSPKMN